MHDMKTDCSQMHLKRGKKIDIQKTNLSHKYTTQCKCNGRAQAQQQQKHNLK